MSLLKKINRVYQHAFHCLMSRLCPVMVVFMLSSMGILSTRSAMAETTNYSRVLPSTVWIITSNAEDQTSTGTGVLIDRERRLVLTNAHVVGESRTAVVFFPEIKDGTPTVKRKKYLNKVLDLAGPGKVIAVDRKRDLALIELTEVPERAKEISLAEKGVSAGEKVDLIGNPGGSDVLWVYTSGTVRSVYDKKFKSDHGQHEFRTVETQTPIKPGDSGGPVVNLEGELVAIAQSFSPQMALVGYCVDIAEIKAFIKSPWKPAPLATKTILAGAGIESTVNATGHYEIERKLTSGKTQTVFVAKDTEYFQKADVRKIWSLVSVNKEEPTSQQMMRLMRQSSATKIGAWAIEKNESDEFLVLFVAKLDATAPDEAVESTIEYVARIAGAMNDQFSPKKATKSSSETLASWLAK